MDRRVTMAVNGAHSPALDTLMVFASDREVWFPLYALLIGALIYWFRRRSLLLLGLLITAIALADRITSGLFKPYFARPRPCHEPDLMALLHLPAGCGGQFGFLSSHAANSIALAVFLMLVLPARQRWVKIAAFGWAVLLCYSRIYLGAHYLTDVLGGGLVGGLLGWGAAVAFRRLTARPLA
ncbi:phosphatase PAP2 family protein [Hymenobacter sp. ASUV-10]|uniref:Phosphatase PAP2 family protein n=1 Tax=Hymenobacter aranciens TaxID=3063996 RepID=A0ABT9BB04_9BACT|nr:phosphatase PAP2 family protein [Hymenobacter sp. ASUV-10]MDO7873881.1 phosphatase PAP2 family protein [Hymenobacter sp. ASUV-10]